MAKLSNEYYVTLIQVVHKRWSEEIDKGYEYSQGLIPREFLGALICKESSGEREAVRNEPHYLYEISRTKLLNGIDALIASSSLGACQVMACYSHQYKMLGKLKTAGNTGWLKWDIKDYFEKPCQVAVDHLFYNCKPFIDKKDWESCARIYNTGSALKTKSSDLYWLGDEANSRPAFSKFLMFYKELLKK